MSNFEERLLHELRGLAVAPTSGQPTRAFWRRPRLVLASGVTAGLAVAVLAAVVFLSAGTPSAYGVTKNADGTVTVEIDSLSDAAGLQTKLQAAGVNAVVQYLPVGKTCQQPWFTPAAPAEGEMQSSRVESTNGGATTFTISGNLATDRTLVITTQTGPGEEQALSIGWAQGDVPACRVVDAPAGG